MIATAGFRICGNKGFHVTFANGYTVSVQFGPGNFCENRDEPFDFDAPRKEGWRSMDAEIAAWGPGGGMRVWPGFEGDTVRGWQSADDVLAFMNMIAALPAGEDK